MNNKKGQSLIDVIFSMGIVVLVLTGIIVLVVNTAKVKRLAFERQKAVELSQLLIEYKILESKSDSFSFWNGGSYGINNKDFGSDFSGYSYTINHDSGCNDQNCKITFTINWGDGQSLSVERLFLRKGI
ncbi:MAG: hypothetical protein PHE32_01630 [Candidatus Shapirobacteria bacterium]|nr:hypothetical protein [Candidatus Shapirobacteria bacterium]MDD4410388.1 hypothetical protein [Candidatus Shapirobacteria bacterium]